MSWADILKIAGDYGQSGLFVGFLVWQQLHAEARRDKIDRDRIEADKEMAAAIVLMRATLEGMRHVP